MKAVVVSEFGAPSVLKLADIPKPEPGRDQVLVRVKAAGVGPWDAWIREGKSALPQPLPLIPGSDISGVVEAAGSAVSAFRPGDENLRRHQQAIHRWLRRICSGRGRDDCAEAEDAGPCAGRFRPVVAVTAWQMLFEYAN